MPTEAICSRSGYGCCWDKKTAKLYADGRNCPGESENTPTPVPVVMLYYCMGLYWDWGRGL